MLGCPEHCNYLSIGLGGRGVLWSHNRPSFVRCQGEFGHMKYSDYLHYALPWESFRKISLEEFLALAGKSEFYDIIIKSQYRDAIEEKFMLFGGAMRVLEARYQFFTRAMEGDAELWAKHGAALGERELSKRLLFAMHHIYIRARRVLRTYNDLLGNYPEYINRVREMINKGDDCKSVQVCMCKGAQEPFMESCLQLDATVLQPFKGAQKLIKNQADIDALFGG
jgi:hypothetical protein